jgi:hypothetical protein
MVICECVGIGNRMVEKDLGAEGTRSGQEERGLVGRAKGQDQDKRKEG